MSLLGRLAALPVRLPTPKTNVHFDQAQEAIRLAFPGIEALQSAELEALINRLDVSIARKSWDELKEGEVATVVRAYAANKVTMPRRVTEFLKRELNASTRENLLGALCDGFIEGWSPRDERVRNLAVIIRDRARWLPKKRQTLFQNAPEPLDVDNGATIFGQWMVGQRDPYEATLSKGIEAPHNVGFMFHAHSSWLASLPPLTDQLLAERVLAWIIPKRAPVLVGGRGASAVARLLQPWHVKMPPAAMRTALVERLVEAYGDPRKDNESFWSQVGGEGRLVMLRWLAGRRMEAFIEVVSHAEAQGAHREQWASRRRFWMGMYEQGRIDEAWVAFTRDARTIADELSRRTGDPAYSSYGLQTGARKDTCLLVMHMGNKVVVEGSHNFRVHVFHRNDPAAPKLYAERYDADEFLLPVGHENARMHDGAGNWTDWVRRKVR